MRLTLPTCFATRRMTARPLEAADLEWLVTLHQNPLVMQNIGGVRSRTITEAWLQSNLDHWAQHGFGEVVLDHASSGARIGRGGLRMIDECVGEELVELEEVDALIVRHGGLCWGSGSRESRGIGPPPPPVG